MAGVMETAIGLVKSPGTSRTCFIALPLQNRPTGHGYVRMKSVAAAGRASEELHKQYIEDRYIEVFQVCRC